MSRDVYCTVCNSHVPLTGGSLIGTVALLLRVVPPPATRAVPGGGVCRTSGATLDLLNPKLQFNKIPKAIPVLMRVAKSHITVHPSGGPPCHILQQDVMDLHRLT